jgi:stage II sporulation protein M
MLFGIYSFFNILSNGIVLGYVFSKLVDASKLTEFWRILPYGIFELPAIFISLALGIKLGMFIFSKEKIAELKIRFKESLIVFVFCVIPLLITAAIIEGVLISFFSNLS